MRSWIKRVLQHFAPQPNAAMPGLKTEGPPIAASRDMTFACRLYEQLASQPGNLFFSPASIRLTLAMVSAGARGETAREMQQVLSLPRGLKAHKALAAQLRSWEALACPVDPGATQPEESEGLLVDWGLLRPQRRRGVATRAASGPGPSDFLITLRVINRVWAQSDRPFLAEFMGLLHDRYRAPLATLDFRRSPELSRLAINQWVSDQTEQRIRDLIAPGDLTAATRMVLTNAVWLQARWLDPFKLSDTKEAPFHVTHDTQVSVPMMWQVGDFLVGRFAGGARRVD